jgi:hypothetical protein
VARIERLERVAEAFAALRDAEYDHGIGGARRDQDAVDEASRAAWEALAAFEEYIASEQAR